MAKRNVEELTDLEGKHVFVRVDYNVPLEQGKITDDTRIRASLPTLKLLLEREARIVLASHLGRPRGAVEPELSLAPAARRVAESLQREVVMAPDCVGPAVASLVAGTTDVVLLENVRFHAGEEKNDPDFAGRLAADSGAEIYVNDAFGTAHRAHASTEGITRHVDTSVAGLLMQKELRYLGMALESPERPFVAILGGAKVSDKIQVIESLLPRVDALLIGGGMAYTFFRAMGWATGKSRVEEDRVELAARLLEQHGDKIALPTDHIVASAFRETAERKTLPAAQTPDGWMGLDIGPETATSFARRAGNARLALWNGPMGVFEMPPFAEGTRAMGRALASCQGTTIVGGGDSVAAVTQLGLDHLIDHVSTGGGASLEFLTGKPLPGVACLDESGGEA